VTSNEKDKVKTEQAGDIQGARQFLTMLSGTLKKINLYSGNHRIYKDALNSLKTALVAFSDRFGSLKIHIRRDRICFGAETIYQGQSELNDLAFILYRDGIQWIDFQPGVELWELDTFLKVLQKYARLEDDSEDDIVTALWQYNLPSIQYEAADLALEVSEDLEISDLKCRPDDAADAPVEIETSKETGGKNAHSSPLPEIPDLARREDLWSLNPGEREQLRKMIAEEEKLDGTDHVIDVLLYILEKQDQPEKETTYLVEILISELREVLLQGRYDYLYHVLVHLKQGAGDANTGMNLSEPCRDLIFKTLMSEVFLGGLKDLENQVETVRVLDMKALKQALLVLPDSSLGTLIPMIPEISTPRMRKLLLELVGIMAKRNFSLFEQMLRSSNPETIVHLILVLKSLKDEKSTGILQSLVKHDSGLVREEALKAILAGEEIFSKDLFRLIEDPDESIRQRVFYRMGRERDERIEEMLMEYLQNHNGAIKDRDSFNLILRTLGKCGSDLSFPFLRNQLFLWPCLGILRPGKDKRQAVIHALQALDSKQASELAMRASKGFLYNFLKSG
jgi:hypothetical protein